jgi:hypothetical protein
MPLLLDAINEEYYDPEDEGLNQYFENNGFDSDLFIKNIGSTIVYFFVFFIIFLIYFFLKIFKNYS